MVRAKGAQCVWFRAGKCILICAIVGVIFGEIFGGPAAWLTRQQQLHQIVTEDLPDLHNLTTAAPHPHGNGVAPRALEKAKPKPRFFLSVLVLMHNEVDRLLEFVLHYLEEGVEHFYIIDDRSSDGTVQLLSTCLQPGRYSISRRAIGEGGRLKPQWHAYASLLPLLQQETEWVIVVDVDEFMTSRAYPSKPIRTLLKDPIIFKDCNVIQVPWLRFSWGNFSKSPKDVRHSLLWRWSLDTCSVEGKGSGKFEDICKHPLTKSIFRPSVATRIKAHFPILGSYSGERCLIMGKKLWRARKERIATPVGEDAVADLALATHHYRIQSFNDLRRKQNSSWQWQSEWLNVPIEKINRLDIYDDYMLNRTAIREGVALHLAARAELANRKC